MPELRTAVVIPSLGAPSLLSCLDALADQTAPPTKVVVVLSGGRPAADYNRHVEFLVNTARLGFAAAANRGINAVLADVDAIALLNDDAEPGPNWLATLTHALECNTGAAVVQGTVTDAAGRIVDGRGLAFDPYGLPTQVDRGRPAKDDQKVPAPRVGVSATAAVFRCSALNDVVLGSGQVFDEAFDSYHEDVDLALRLWRLGQRAYWVSDAPCRHLGSKTGSRRPWRHSRWILANRWRALAGNLTPLAMARFFPGFVRGEIRAVRTLARDNPRTWAVAALVPFLLPYLVVSGLMRDTPGPRLGELPRPAA